MEESKFKIGDRVMIVKYGHPAYVQNENMKKVMFDTAPNLVGKVGTIDQTKEVKGEYVYALEGIKEKYAWYDAEQLEKFEITIN